MSHVVTKTGVANIERTRGTTRTGINHGLTFLQVKTFFKGLEAPFLISFLRSLSAALYSCSCALSSSLNFIRPKSQTNKKYKPPKTTIATPRITKEIHHGKSFNVYPVPNRPSKSIILGINFLLSCLSRYAFVINFQTKWHLFK